MPAPLASRLQSNGVIGSCMGMRLLLLTSTSLSCPSSLRRKNPCRRLSSFITCRRSTAEDGLSEVTTGRAAPVRPVRFGKSTCWTSLVLKLWQARVGDRCYSSRCLVDWQRDKCLYVKEDNTKELDDRHSSREALLLTRRQAFPVMNIISCFPPAVAVPSS